MVLHLNYKTTHSSSVIQRRNSLSGELHSKILTNSHLEFIMKKVAILLSLIVTVFGQPSFTAHNISTSADGAYFVHAVDLDGDGDIDVLSALIHDDKIAWYENNGSESFTAHNISTSADGASSVYAVDLDGDGDMDVLASSKDDDKISWYENNGSESFTTHTIATSANAPFSVYAVDVDGDGDIDVLSASIHDDKIAWYENNGSESFTAHTISTDADYAFSVYAVDLDGDGDMDVLSASINDDKIAWYENNGSESFTVHNISTDADGAESVYAVDVDGDGDLDLLLASGGDDTIAWYENNGSESFTAHAITTSADGAYSVYAIDVDGDGDMDVLSASGEDDKIAWYENDGSESFTAHTITTSADGAETVYAVDVDGDGDIDVLSASLNDDKIAWYEQLHSGPVWYVSTSGSDSNEGVKSSPFSTIQAAIDAASSGDTVLVADGTYTENLIIYKDIKIISENGAEKTIIDGGKIKHVIEFNSSALTTRDCVLDGFTITNGGNANGSSDEAGGGINVWSGSPTLRNLIIKGNRREAWSGGGIHVSENANPLVEGCIIKENYAESGGGGIDVWRASIKIKDTILENNSAKYTGAMSIGTDDTLDFRPIIDIENVEVINQRDSTIEQMVAFSECSLTVKNVSFSNIRTESSLGSFYNSYVNIENLSLKDIRDNGHSLLIIDSKGTVSGLTIERDTSRWAIAKIENGSKIDFNNLKMSNSKTSDFSGLFIDDATVTIDTLDINNCNWESHSIRVNKSIFTLSNGNISSIISENGNAGIEASESSSVEISNTTINSSSSGGHAMNFNGVKKVSITNSLFNGNHSQSSGGVIFAREIDSLLIENSSFVADTSGGEGGAIQLSDKNQFVRILKSTFSNNSASGAGAINSWNTDSLFIDNSTFDGNESMAGGGGAVSINADGAISTYFEIKNSDFTGNKAGVLGGALWIGNSEGYIQNVGIFNNESVDNFGGGIYISENVELTMNAVTISGNSSPEPAGEGIAIDGGNIIIKNSIIWDNHIQKNSGSIDITYSNIEGGFTGTGNIDANPLFCDYWSGSWPQLAGNYHLTFLSPAIGKGENGVNMGAFDVGCDIDTALLSVDEPIDVTPTEYALHDNYPNPFNPTTTLRFDLPEVSDITLTIYNMLGQKVRTFNMQNTSAGYHSIMWDATNNLGEQVGAGVYLYQLRANQFVKTRKMVLLK